MLTSSLLLASSIALAGKLGDGWRGHAYGDAVWLATAPSTNCKSKPEADVEWECSETIGANRYDVAYMVTEGLYTGVIINCANFSACDNLLTTVTAAWGVCTPGEYTSGPLPECRFRTEGGAADAGRVMGSWNFNQYSSEGYIMSIALEQMSKAKAITATRAAEAAKGL